MARWRRIAWCAGLGLASTVLASVAPALFWWDQRVTHVRTEARVQSAPNYSPLKTPAITVERTMGMMHTHWHVWTGALSVPQRDHVPTATTPSEITPDWMIQSALANADWRDAPGGIHMEFVQSGWPLRAFQCRGGPGTQRSDLPVSGAIVLYQYPRPASGVRQRSDIVAPWHPVWRGLMADTAIFGSAWWLLFSLISLTRARWRRRRGRCPQCGYSRSGLAPQATCPECGRNAVSINTSTA